MFEKNWTAFHSPGQDQVRTVTNESCIKMIKNSQNPFIINHKGFLSIGPVSEANQFSRFGRIRKEFSHIFDSFNHRRQNADSLQFQMRETRLVTIFLQFSSPGFWTATAALSGDNWQSAVYLHCSRSADLSRAPVHHYLEYSHRPTPSVSSSSMTIVNMLRSSLS